MIHLKASKNPKLSISVTGLVRCRHQFDMHVRGDEIFSRADLNWSDTNPDDEDSKLETDVYALGSVLKDNKGRVGLDWALHIARSGRAVEPYEVIVSIVQDNVPVLHERYRSDDDGVDPSRTARVVFDGVNLKVS
jgi:hypothetical protein